MIPDWVAGLSIADVMLPLTILCALGWGLRKAWPWLSKAKDFLDDVAGEPGRPGVVARPGLMERMQTLETSVTAIHHEVFPNSGESMRDAVNRTEKAVGEMRDGLADETARTSAHRAESDRLVTEFEGRMSAVEAATDPTVVIAHLAEALPIIARSTPPEENP